ncbi:MAG: hypothetical protein HDQ88_08845 [Clostridia bacterium]|nr:hypothetical protein [Clostridia bacterium]
MNEEIKLENDTTFYVTELIKQQAPALPIKDPHEGIFDTEKIKDKDDDK